MYVTKKQSENPVTFTSQKINFYVLYVVLIIIPKIIRLKILCKQIGFGENLQKMQKNKYNILCFKNVKNTKCSQNLIKKLLQKLIYMV